MKSVFFEPDYCQLENGWVSRSVVMHTEDTIQLWLDPNIALSFTTEHAAGERNRQLAWSWKEKRHPEADLFELPVRGTTSGCS
jgi:hypothetical protein